jgi:cell wall-associated NlpC family hydrolase
MEINELIGLPWKRGGRDPQEGFDCWGFLKWYYREKLGLVITYDYAHLPGQTRKIVTAFDLATSETGDWEQIKNPTDNCAVALSMNNRIHHVGVWVSGGCLHATEGVGVVYNTIKQLKRNGYAKVEFYKCKTVFR